MKFVDRDVIRCQSSRNLTTRIKEHSRVSSPVGSNFLQCGVKLTLDDVKILATSQTQKHLMILEAIFINDTKPVLNTKDEYKRHTLVIKFQLFIFSFTLSVVSGVSGVLGISFI